MTRGKRIIVDLTRLGEMFTERIYMFLLCRSADIKIIDLDDRENGYALKGHKKAISALSFDPKGEYLVRSPESVIILIRSILSIGIF